MNRANFETLLAKAKRSARFAVSHGQSPILSLACSNATDTHLSTTSLFLTAFAAINEGDFEGWVTARGLMAMADLVFHHHSEFKRLPSPNQDALYYGAITAMWNIVTPDQPMTPDRIREARSRLVSKIRRMGPPLTMIKGALSNWTTNWIRGDVINRHALLLHWFPLRLSNGASDEIINIINSVCTGGDQEDHVELTNEQILALKEPKTAEDLAGIWHGLDDRELTAFFVTVSCNNTKYEVDLIKAMFCLVSTTTKTSFSDQWLQSRWSNIQQDNPILIETDAVDREVLSLYENFFQRPLVSINKKVTILYYGYFLAHQQRLEGVKRIIEQSKAPHVSGLNALCNLTLRFPTVTYTVLKQIFGIRQVNSVIKLAACLIHNPYATLVSTPIPVSMYADIAYVATEILYSSNQQRRSRQARYISPAEKSLTKTVEYLKAFAANLVAEQERRATQDMASHAILSAYGLSIVESRENVIIVSNVGAEVPVDPQHVNQPGPTRFEIATADFDAFIRSRRTEKDNSFIEVMSELNRVSSQAALPMPTGDDAAVSATAMRAEALSEAMMRHLNILEIQHDREWTEPTALLEVESMGTYRVSVGLTLSALHRYDPPAPGAPGGAAQPAPNPVLPPLPAGPAPPME